MFLRIDLKRTRPVSTSCCNISKNKIQTKCTTDDATKKSGTRLHYFNCFKGCYKKKNPQVYEQPTYRRSKVMTTCLIFRKCLRTTKRNSLEFIWNTVSILHVINTKLQIANPCSQTPTTGGKPESRRAEAVTADVNYHMRV